MESPKAAAFSGRLWLDKDDQRFLGKGRAQLLELIGQHGSITHAAKAMGMSYKAAWEAVDLMNNLADQPLVVRTRGGAHGGETHLTDYGRELVTLYQVFHEEHARFLAALSGRMQRAESVTTLMRRFGMRTSARNQFWGQVVSLTHGTVNTEVTMTLGEDRLVASLTHESAEALGLREGLDVCALIKASWVVLALPQPGLRTSARNCLAGTVTQAHQGTVTGEVTLALKGERTITATVTAESIRALGLKEGTEALALIKASHVILAVHD